MSALDLDACCLPSSLPRALSAADGGEEAVLAERKDRRPWRLVAPWYRWPDGPGRGRGTAPVIQKYATSKSTSAFAKDPQRSLTFIDEDFVHKTVSAKLALPLLVGKRRFTNLIRAKTETRKIFLETHHRSYLVVCELHCDAPGFPNAQHDEACEAGMVVRRRRIHVPDGVDPLPARELVESFALASARLTGLQTLAAPRSKPSARASASFATVHAAAVADAVEGSIEAQLAHAQLELAAQKQKLFGWASAIGLRDVVEGWFPSEHEGVGAWRPVADRPLEPADEAVFPLYPLVPDPRDPKHAAKGRAIWFGVLPVSSSDTDARGKPRFDDQSLYEVRCFVRRHKRECEKTRQARDCRGEVVWSERSERYQLASHFDLDGTSHKPVTIQLPDLKALEAQAFAGPLSGAVRMQAPPDSNLEFDVDDDGNPIKLPFGAGICSFSIPLITIVASFVLRLFLPIVVFVFGLFFLLKLKFCIPGGISVQMAADLSASMGAAAGADFAAELAVEVELPDVTAGLEFEAAVEVTGSASVSAGAPSSASAGGGIGV